jgi:gas vesicle protein
MRTSSDTHAGSGSFLMGLITGIAGGAALAALYAPSSGRDMRQQLAERAREGRERAMAAAEQGREQASAAAEKGRALMNEGRDAIAQGREVLSTAMDEGRDAYRQTKARETR